MGNVFDDEGVEPPITHADGNGTGTRARAGRLRFGREAREPGTPRSPAPQRLRGFGAAGMAEPPGAATPTRPRSPSDVETTRPAEGPPLWSRARVVLRIADEAFHQEVLDFLVRDPRIEVVASARSAARLTTGSDHSGADLDVVCPVVAASIRPARSRGSRPLVVVAEEMTVPVLREAIEAAAGAVFAWPDERTELARAIVDSRASRDHDARGRGRIVAVVGARGGAGATFISTHLAAAFAAEDGRRPVLIDVDPRNSDVTPALGVIGEKGVRTVRDLVPVMTELSPEHIEDGLHRHPAGFAVLLGPPDAEGPDIPAGLYRAVGALLAFDYDPVVLHVSRQPTPSAREIVAVADTVVLVTTLDLFSLYGARRTIAALRLDDQSQRCRVVVNRSSRSVLGPADVERILGIRPALTVRSDPRVQRAQQRGELVPMASRGAARDVRRLMRALTTPDGTTAGTEPA